MIFNGPPRDFIACVLRGDCSAASATVGAASTDFVPVTASTPRLATLLGVGNSLTLDYFHRMTGLLAQSQAQHPGQVWRAVNLGVGKATTPELTAMFAATHARYFSPHRVSVLHFCELTNHIGAGATFAVARDAAMVYCATARAAGWRVAFHIPTPRAERSRAGYESSASAWQTGQKAIYEQICAHFRANNPGDLPLLDLSAALPDPYDTALYLPDGCHFTEAGIAIKAAAVAISQS